MKKKIELITNRLKKYENIHPYRPIVMGIVVTILVITVFEIGIKMSTSKKQGESKVEFNDEYFEKEVQTYLGKTDIYQSDLDAVTKLEILNNSHVADITDLEKLPNLKNLTIKNCKVEDISVIGKLTELVTLDLSINRIYKVEGLSSLPNLQILYLSNNIISDISSLCDIVTLAELDVSSNNIRFLPEDIKKLENLQTFACGQNRLTDIKAVNGMENLGKLSAAGNKLEKEIDLRNLPKLLELNLSNNFLEGLDSLGDLDTLEKLNLEKNNLTDLSFLVSCPNLSDLYIASNDITTLEGLDVCKSLQLLDIRGTQIIDIELLTGFEKFNTIYLDDNFDRSKIDFMIGNFRNGDNKTKEYLLKRQYDLQ